MPNVNAVLNVEKEKSSSSHIVGIELLLSIFMQL